MKEISIEQKAARYDKALVWMRDLYPTMEGAMKEDAEHYFPELKESKDDRIREKLVALIEWSKSFLPSGITADEAKELVAWLEKQGEQNPVVIIPKFRIGDYVKNVNDKREPIYEIVYIDKECYICEYRGTENMGDKAVMHFAFDCPYLRRTQKPAWSEEDEKKRKGLIKGLEDRMGFGWTSDTFSREEYIDWLKSLKERYTWKPSEEQILAINTAINVLGKGTISGRCLIELQEQLNKLKE